MLSGKTFWKGVRKMKREILYPELTTLYGDGGNMLLFKQCCNDAVFRETGLEEIPWFVSEDVDFICIGSMSEPKQLLVREKLRPHKERIIELIEKGTVFLVTGNALELFGQYIEDRKERIEMLGIFDYHAQRNLDKRLNYIVLAQYEELPVVAVKSQFSQIYGLDEHHFMKVIKGLGDNEGSEYEGIHYRNFFGTYCLGPLLVYNPQFTRSLLKLCGQKGEIVFEKELEEAYDERLRKYRHPDSPAVLGHGFI